MDQAGERLSQIASRSEAMVGSDVVARANDLLEKKQSVESGIAGFSSVKEGLGVRKSEALEVKGVLSAEYGRVSDEMRAIEDGLMPLFAQESELKSTKRVTEAWLEEVVRAGEGIDASCDKQIQRAKEDFKQRRADLDGRRLDELMESYRGKSAGLEEQRIAIEKNKEKISSVDALKKLLESNPDAVAGLKVVFGGGVDVVEGSKKEQEALGEKLGSASSENRANVQSKSDEINSRYDAELTKIDEEERDELAKIEQSRAGQKHQSEEWANEARAKLLAVEGDLAPVQAKIEEEREKYSALEAESEKTLVSVEKLYGGIDALESDMGKMSDDLEALKKSLADLVSQGAELPVALDLLGVGIAAAKQEVGVIVTAETTRIQLSRTETLKKSWMRLVDTLKHAEKRYSDDQTGIENGAIKARPDLFKRKENGKFAIAKENEGLDGVIGMAEAVSIVNDQLRRQRDEAKERMESTGDAARGTWRKEVDTIEKTTTEAIGQLEAVQTDVIQRIETAHGTVATLAEMVKSNFKTESSAPEQKGSVFSSISKIAGSALSGVKGKFSGLKRLIGR